MSKAILITRPNHDLITTYLSHWSSFVIKEAERKRIKVLDLRGDKASNKMFSSYITEHEPLLVFLNGHGNADTITGYNNEPLIETNKNENLLIKKIVYARSCDSANNLGKLCIQNGTLAFIGYTKNSPLAIHHQRPQPHSMTQLQNCFLNRQMSYHYRY